MSHSERQILTDGTDSADITTAGAVKVDGSGVTQPVSGTVTANAGTNLNTSALALEATQSSIKTAVEVMDDWDESDRAKVNPIVGQAGVAGGSGTTAANVQRVVLATDVALPSGTNTIGNVGEVALTTGGASMYSLISGASTNATNIKSSAGQLYALYITNTTAAALKVNIYDKATAPTPGTDVPKLRLLIPEAPTAGTTMGGTTWEIPVGASFANGIGFSMHANLTSDTDAASTVTAGALIINALYK